MFFLEINVELFVKKLRYLYGFRILLYINRNLALPSLCKALHKDGDQLYRYLHISKRKMKYLLENGYIPVIDTGKKTYRYRVKRCDAERFKERMERESDFLAELKGRFGSRDSSMAATLDYALTDDERDEFREFLIKLWKKHPDALPAKKAAEIADISPQRVNELVRKGDIYGMCVRNVQYLAKEQFIEYIAVNCRTGKLVKRFRGRGDKL